MALGLDYARQDCSLARALEVVGERWTLLVLRDCFFGVRRFSDFAAHLDISRAVLSQRLAALVDAGLLARTSNGGHAVYTVTDEAVALWPAIFALSQWGEQHSSPGRPRRLFTHADAVAPCAGPASARGAAALRCPRTSSRSPDLDPPRRHCATMRSPGHSGHRAGCSNRCRPADPTGQ